MKWMLAALACASCGKKAAAPADLGAAAHPMGAIKDVRIGMTADQVKAAAPALQFDKAGEIASSDKDGEMYSVFMVDGKVSFFEAQFTRRAPDELWKAWGGHGIDIGHEHFRFFDAHDHLRADVYIVSKGFAVRFTDFVPLATQLAGPDTKAIDGIEVLGRPMADVVADFKKTGARIHSTAEMTSVSLPPSEFSGDLASLDLDADGNGVVTSWAMIGTALSDTTPEVKKLVVEAYTKRWGEPRTLGQRMTFNREPWIFADDSLMVSGWLNGLERMGYAAGSGSGSASGSAHTP